MFDPCAPRACGIVAKDILKVLSKAKLNNKIILVDTVYTQLYFDISHIVFICFMSSVICVHAATDSSPSTGSFHFLS